MPAALNASNEIRALAKFRLPLAVNTPPEQRYGPALLFGLGPVHDMDRQRLAELVERALPERFAETGHGEPPEQVRDQAAAEVRAIADAGVAELLLTTPDVAQFCKQHGIPLAARGSATSSLVAWALGLVELCPLDYHVDSQLFVHDGRGDLPDLDLEVFRPARAGRQRVSGARRRERLSTGARSYGALPVIGTLRLGINVSLGARQAVWSVGTALGLDPIRVNSLARQVPLLSSPGAIDQVLTRSPEMGGTLSASAEPGMTILRVARRIERLPHRFGAHPSAYAVSFYGRGAMSWLPAHWVSADRLGRFGGPRHLAMTAQASPGQSDLTHPSAVAPNEQVSGGLAMIHDDADDAASLGDVAVSGGGPVLVSAWDKLSCGSCGKKNGKAQRSG